MINSNYVPSPDEIQQQCTDIRSEWTDDEVMRRKRPRFLSIWLPTREQWAMLGRDSILVQPGHKLLGSVR